MIHKNEYPILEFDDNKEAKIDPKQKFAREVQLSSNKLVITFFKEVIKKLLKEGKIKEYRTLSGENDLLLYKYNDTDVLLIHGLVGCPATAGYLDALIGLGIEKVMFCGGGGILDNTIDVGELLVVEGAIRDEGFSYHYIKPSRIIYSQKEVRKKICVYLKENKIKFREGLSWTTDCIYRETDELIKYRKAEGATIVEMEQSGCIAVSEYRGIQYGAILYSGDDVSKNSWDQRLSFSRNGIRYNLVQICMEIVLSL